MVYCALRHCRLARTKVDGCADTTGQQQRDRCDIDPRQRHVAGVCDGKAVKDHIAGVGNAGAVGRGARNGGGVVTAAGVQIADLQDVILGDGLRCARRKAGDGGNRATKQRITDHGAGHGNVAGVGDHDCIADGIACVLLAAAIGIGIDRGLG